MKKYFINDVQWWYDNGGYDMAKIADLLVNLGAEKVNFKPKYNQKNLPDVIIFSTIEEKLKTFESKFAERFGSEYSFSCKPIW